MRHTNGAFLSGISFVISSFTSFLNLLQVDFSKSIIEWVKGEGYALLDVNLFPKPPSRERSVSDDL